MDARIKKCFFKTVVQDGKKHRLMGFKSIIDGEERSVEDTRALMKHFLEHLDSVNCEECKMGLKIAELISAWVDRDEADQISK